MRRTKRATPPELADGDLFFRAASGARSSGLIGFRLGVECYEELAERAALHKLSVNLYARSIILEALSCNEIFTRMEFVISELQKESHRLRRDIAFFMQTLLMTAGKMPEKDAVEWVKRNFEI